MLVSIKTLMMICGRGGSGAGRNR